jgi:hypothetical protein
VKTRCKVRSWAVTAGLVAIVATAGLMSVPQEADAWEIMDYGYHYRAVSISTYYCSTEYRNALNSACSAWKSAGVGVNPTTTTTYCPTNYARCQSTAQRWYGMYEPLAWTEVYYPHMTTNFRILLNTYQMGGLTAAQKRGTAAHELGHLWGLDEEYSHYALMRSGAGYCPKTINTPQSDDKAGVRASWSR